MYLATRRNNFYDNFFNEMFRSPFFGFESEKESTKLMKTNVQEVENGYKLDIELPGYDKSDIKAELNDGYLTITAQKKENKEEQDDNGKYIRKEIFEGICKRSFYVGEYVHEEDIKASYNNGILTLAIPKEQEPVKEQPKLIEIC